MRVLLISPANDSLRVTEKGGRPKGHRYFRFSMLSLLYVAACSPKDIEIKLVDEQIEPVDFNEDVDLVGISFMTALAPRAYQLADQFRRRGVKVVCGGFHPSLYHQEVLAHADSVCVGEAEATWPRLLEDFRSGRLQHIYRAEKRVELAKINFPRRDLLKRKYYARRRRCRPAAGVTIVVNSVR